MLQMASSNTLMQTLVDDDKRGRVMSMFAMSFFGTVPLGNFIAGSLGSRIGTPATVMLGGICCILGALYFLYYLPAIRECERPVYRRKGILPEVATGLQAADSVHKRP